MIVSLAAGLLGDTVGIGGRLNSYFVDSVSGSDSNNGLSLATAFATLTKLNTVWQVGQSIGLAKGSHFHEQLTNPGAGCAVVAVGTGDRPIIDGSRPISAISWTPDPTYSDVYYADITHETATTPDASDPLNSNTFHCSTWEDDTLLIGVFDGIDIAANRAALTSGTFTAHLQGSTDADPRTGTGGTAYRYYVRLSDDGDPRSNGAVIYYAEQKHAALLSTNGTYRGLEFRRNANKDLVGHTSGQGTATLVEVSDCVFRDGAVHGCVIRPKLLKDCYAYGRSDGHNRELTGYGFNLYFPETEGNYTPPLTVQNCLADEFSIGIGSHGTSTTLPVHDSLTLIGNTTTDCDVAISHAKTVNGLTITGHTATNCVGAINPTSATTVTGLSYLSTTDGNCTAFLMKDNLTLEDSSLVFRSSIKNKIATNYRAELASDTEDVVTLTINNVSIIGGTVPETDIRAQVLITGSDNILGDLSDSAETVSYTLDLTNSYVSEKEQTIAEMVTAGQTLTDCLSPWALEEQTVTVAGGDLDEVTTSRYASSAGTGLTEVTWTASSSINAINALRIANWNGSGGDFYTFLTEKTDVNVNGGRSQIYPATPGSFSTKQGYAQYYNQQFTFDAPLREYSAEAPTHGPYATITYGALEFTVRQASVLYYFDMPTVRYVATTGETAGSGTPQIVAATGVIDAGFDVIPGAELTVGAVSSYAVADLVWDGTPTSNGVAIIDETSQLYALGMGRQS